MWAPIQFVSDKAEKDNKVQEGILSETSPEKVAESLKPFTEMLDKDEAEKN